jgi:hypothetical protein
VSLDFITISICKLVTHMWLRLSREYMMDFCNTLWWSAGNNVAMPELQASTLFLHLLCCESTLSATTPIYTYIVMHPYALSNAPGVLVVTVAGNRTTSLLCENVLKDVMWDAHILWRTLSFTNEVTGYFNWPNPCSRTMALGSTQPLTEMSTRNRPGGKGRLARKADNLNPICEAIV